MNQLYMEKSFISILSDKESRVHAPLLNLDDGVINSNFEITNNNSRFFRITELSQEEQIILRQDLENVIACLNDPKFNWIYYISGTEDGIEIYLGVVSASKNAPIHSYGELLSSQLIGNLTGVRYDDIKREQLASKIIEPLKTSEHFGLLHGVPSKMIEEEQSSDNITQGIDRLARGLSGEVWQLILVAQPAQQSEIYDQIDQLLQLSSDLHPYLKRSNQTGANVSQTESETDGTSDSYATTVGSGKNYSETAGHGRNRTVTNQTGVTTGTSETWGTNESHSVTKTETKNNGGSYTETVQMSDSSSNGKNNHSKGASITKSASWGSSTSNAESVTKGTNYSKSNNISHSNSKSLATGTNENYSKTIGGNTNYSKSDTKGVNHSITQGRTLGASTVENKEYVNKKLERIQTYINEKLIERFDLGINKGMFKTAIYLAAPKKDTYNRLSRSVISIFQGNQGYFTPLRVNEFKLPLESRGQLFLTQKIPSNECDENVALIHSIPKASNHWLAATWLNASELSLLAGLPSQEVCGIKLRKNIDFSVNPVNPKHGFELGSIIQHGRILKNTVYLDKKLLNQHIFISGTTGAGKTTTCQQILIKSELPFLVIEPAKTEYRSLSKNHHDVEYYTLGNEKISPFRFNPFELLRNESLSGHIDMLKATFIAVFPMEASMPYLIEEAIVKSYEKKGWNIHLDENFLYDDPWNSEGKAFPILSEMLVTLKEVIQSKKFGQELQEKYEGSLISRLDNLTIGSKGRMLNTRNSINIEQLLDKKVVIELDDLKDEQDKSLMMALLIGRVAEAIKQRHKKDHNFQHLTLIEEAHRLLSKPESGEDSSKRLGVELFANLLAEVRKYGEGIIIADQIPNKLTPEVLKNTNTKIIHRLFAADDRHAIGDTVGLDDDQKEFLTMLNAGEAIIYSAGWHGAVRVQIKEPEVSTNSPEINENVIKEKAWQRIFEQRAILYPTVCKSLNNHNEVSYFRDYIEKSTKLLNLLFFWGKNMENAQLTERIYKNIVEFKKEYGQSGKENLISLLEDITTIPLDYKIPENSKEGFTISECLGYLWDLINLKELQKTERLSTIFKLDELKNAQKLNNIKDFCIKTPSI